MGHAEMTYLLRLLHDFKREDFGDMPEFVGGGWTRRNLQSLIEDIHATRWRHERTDGQSGDAI